MIQASKDLIDLGIPMNAEDFNVLPALVRAELVKHNLVTEREGLYFFSDSAKRLLQS